MTKKNLVAFDPSKPEAKSADFLAPVVESGRIVLFGLKSQKIQSMGLVVFSGKELSPNDVFARIVDTGRQIESVDTLLADISEYLAALKNQRIGDVVTIDRKDDRVTLIRTDFRPTSKRVPLP